MRPLALAALLLAATPALAQQGPPSQGMSLVNQEAANDAIRKLQLANEADVLNARLNEMQKALAATTKDRDDAKAAAKAAADKAAQDADAAKAVADKMAADLNAARAENTASIGTIDDLRRQLAQAKAELAAVTKERDNLRWRSTPSPAPVPPSGTPPQ